ncbi:unnamed protein product, partial [Iphiclides podalirius]
MALKLKYSDEHGVLQIDMEPARGGGGLEGDGGALEGPRFDSVASRFGRRDLLGGGAPSLFRSRYNSIEEELANTPYAFAHRSPLARTDSAPKDDLFGPPVPPAFTVTQLIHAQDRYFDLSARQGPREGGAQDEGAFGARSAPGSAKTRDHAAFKVLTADPASPQSASASLP